MKLEAVTIQRFRNFVEPQRVEIEGDVTCLVGKNESGKTTILKALHRLNPANGDGREFDLVTEYPRWRLSRDRRNEDLDQLRPVTADFTLDTDDLAELDAILPAEPPRTARVHAARNYANEWFVWIDAPLADVIREASASASVDERESETLLAADSIDAAISAAKDLAKSLKESDPARSKAASSFPATVQKYRYLLEESALEQEARDALSRCIPKFFYFSDYSVLPGEADLTLLARKVAQGQAISGEEQTVLSLLDHAGVSPDDFLDENYDSRKAELQAASSDLSREVFRYWKANTDLAVIFGEDNVPMPAPQGTENRRLLKIELRDARHGDVETNFATRSSGFQWFFSFFAAFSEYQNSDRQVVVLLDEPGTSLHGEAQKDFVNYIHNELGASKQTIYTTHSQFMVDPTTYEKLRAVHDKATRHDQEAGVAVTRVNLSADRDTILPVESALGYSVSQHLFLGSGKHLLVEGSSDFIFLMRLSAYMESKRKTPLSPELAIIPVGGITNMPAFVALMGRRLEVSVLVDGAKTSSVLERTRKAASDNQVPPSRIVAVCEVDEELPGTADIEDLFSTPDYLKLYNWAFRKNLQESDLPVTKEPILKRITLLEGKFDHALPAHALTEHQKEFWADISSVTVERFGALFKKLNK